MLSERTESPKKRLQSVVELAGQETLLKIAAAQYSLQFGQFLAVEIRQPFKRLLWQ
jgi:hypothetical protein